MLDRDASWECVANLKQKLHSPIDAQMDIAIIIATRNSGLHLKNCLDSILRQTQRPKQVIVQDGLSCDDTTSILRGYEERFSGILDWRSERDMGIADAWNKALKSVAAEWILFLGADDTLYDQHTLGYASVALNGVYPSHRVAYGVVELCDQTGRTIKIMGCAWQLCAIRFRQCLEFLPHQGTFHHKSLFLEHGEFDSGLQISCDYDFLLRELISKDARYLGSRPIARMLNGGISTSRRNILRVNLERINLHRRHSSDRVPFRLYWKACKAFVISMLYRAGGDEFARRATNIYRSQLRGKARLLV